MTGRERIAPLGAQVGNNGTRFRVWAPAARRVALIADDRADDRSHEMKPAGDGYFELQVPDMGAGALYRYRLDDRDPTPDPASRFQPRGVHGPSEVVDPGAYRWNDAAWTGIEDPRRLVFYELHVGTFSPEGSFEGVRRRLPHLQSLGVTAIELMPVADFPGRWNWGYDPAALWAPSRAYGRPDELRALIDEAHQRGMAVFLDVVYNHLGPDGAYVAAYGPFFNDKHQTPWGASINLDGEGAAGVRHFLLANALHWLEEYHFDGMRLDATFALIDDSPTHFLTELAADVEALPGPRRYLFAEDHRNLDTLVRPRTEGGHGLDGVWADDFHHIVRRLAAGDRHGYFRPYPDSTVALARTIEQGWYFTGQALPPPDEPRGTPTTGLRKDQFVLCIQNHDQVGNRAQGDRLHHQVEPAVYRALSALLLFLPETPLLFMGQEWAAGTPFQYFTDHEPALGRLVSEGRRREFEHFPAFHGQVPDPQETATFERSKLDWDELDRALHRGTLALYRDLLIQRPGLAGELRAHSPVAGALWLQRGSHRMLIALEPGLRVPIDLLPVGSPEPTPGPDQLAAHAPDASSAAPGAAAAPDASSAARPAGSTGRSIVWHSEDPCYTSAPRPPWLDGDHMVFDAPAAVVMVMVEDRP